MITQSSDVLYKLRAEAGLTQEQVAERIGVERATYARYESGDRKISAVALILLAHMYRVSPEYIMVMDELDTDSAWEKELVFSARRLNEAGRRQLVKQVNYLLSDPDYTKKQSELAI